MIRTFLVAFGLSAAIATAAMAQTTPPAPPAPAASPAKPDTPAKPEATPTAVANPDECLKAAIDLAQSAESAKLGDDKLDKIEELLTKMEAHCDAKRFTEAMAVATDIRGIIDGK